MTTVAGFKQPPRTVRINWRAIAWQVALVSAVVWLGYEAVTNAAQNMRARNIPTDFSFWFNTAGFDINQTYVSYSATSTYGQAFLVGLINTLVVAAIGIVIATLLGFVIGVARLSSNWMISKLAEVYVEILRNTPLLLQLLFWYNAVLKPLPGPRQSLALPALTLQWPGLYALTAGLLALAAGGFLLRWSRARTQADAAKLLSNLGGSIGLAVGVLLLLFGGQLIGVAAQSNSWSGIMSLSGGQYGFLNARGLYLPAPMLSSAMVWVGGTFLAAIVVAFAVRAWLKQRQKKTGQIWPVGWIVLGLLIIPPVLAFLALGAPVSFDVPKLRGFNLAGGWRVFPEFFALLLGLSLYTAAFIAEIVRAGILSVPKGQTEAANALGVRRSVILKKIVIPQAMRVIVPPLTNQYLNLTKNSSLAVFIGYPDLVQVFAGTVLNQTGAAVQIIAITMAVYLVISLFTSLLMNFYNRRVSLVER